MRRRLEKFLPIVLIALMVQILAPIGACWAAALAVSDPLTAAEICHADPGLGSGAGDQSGQHRTHDGACAICCAAQASTALETPQPTIMAAPYRDAAAIVWHKQAEDLPGARVGSNAQARAPPFIS
jgi:Protein of unknown function (DUF2946)